MSPGSLSCSAELSFAQAGYSIQFLPAWVFWKTTDTFWKMVDTLTLLWPFVSLQRTLIHIFTLELEPEPIKVREV